MKETSSIVVLDWNFEPRYIAIHPSWIRNDIQEMRINLDDPVYDQDPGALSIATYGRRRKTSDLTLLVSQTPKDIH